mmetsp:Transcript_25995/g.44147  ORF Transcript_25995/g.44147 Transcript_25995/m.44147 type:complete len:95 (+) Transcript_25995:1852-2136(+)
MLCFSILMGNSFRMHKRRDGGIIGLLRLTFLVIELVTASRERGVDDCIVVVNLVSVIGYLRINRCVRYQAGRAFDVVASTSSHVVLFDPIHKVE